MLYRQKLNEYLMSFGGFSESVRMCGRCAYRPETQKDCLRPYKLKGQNSIGSGKYSQVYEIDISNDVKQMNKGLPYNKPFIVKKVSLLQNDYNAESFRNEVCICRRMGEAGIGPVVYDCWVCGDYGYIVMEQIATMWKSGYACVDEELRKKSRASESVQRQLVSILLRMIRDHSVIHNDCHPGNVGIRDDGSVVLFDFGLSVSSVEKISHPEQVLLGQLMIFLEGCDAAGMYPVIYDAVMNIRRNSWEMFSRDLDKEYKK